MLKICNDTSFMGPGVIVGDEETRSCFKMFAIGIGGFPEICFTAMDSNVDTCLEKNEIREIKVNVKKEDPIYPLVQSLYGSLNGEEFYSKFKEYHKNNHFRMDQNNGDYNLIFGKDIYVGGDACHLNLGDYLISDQMNKHWEVFMFFYKTLLSHTNCKFEDVAHLLGIQVENKQLAIGEKE